MKTNPIVVQQKMNELEGRDTASAGAEEIPTDEISEQKLPDDEQPPPEETPPSD